MIDNSPSIPRGHKESVPQDVLSDATKLKTALMSLLDKENNKLTSRKAPSEREKHVLIARRESISDLLCSVELAIYLRNMGKKDGYDTPEKIVDGVSRSLIQMLIDPEFAASSQQYDRKVRPTQR